MNSALKSRLKHAGKNTKMGRLLVQKTKVLKKKAGQKLNKAHKRNLKRIK